MSTVSKKHFANGDAATAAELNSPYDDLETASSAIDDGNTASSWMTIKHIDNSTNQCNRLDKYSNNTNSPVAYNNTAYVTINQGGADAVIIYTGFFPQNAETTRFSASGLVPSITLNSDLGLSNYYAFRMLLTYSDGGGPDQTLTLQEWGYSFSPRSRITNDSTGVGSSGNIQYQTFQFSTLLRHDGPTDNREYKKVELQVKVQDAGNTVNITRHQLFSISGKA